jgi:hypothetical protein
MANEIHEIHEYFNRKTADWGVLDFLNECGIEPFEKKIDTYIKSLNNIVKFEGGKRNKRACILLERYSKASK